PRRRAALRGAAPPRLLGAGPRWRRQPVPPSVPLGGTAVLDRAEEQLLDEHPDALWELFHENSKASRYERHAVSVLWPSDAAVGRAMQRLRTVKAYDDHPALALPTEIPASRGGFDDLVLGRTTARSFDGGGIELAALAKILHFAYGITRDNAGTAYPRPFRAV